MARSASDLPDVDAPETARAGIRAAFKIRDHWQLTRPELTRLLGIRSETTLRNWTAHTPERLAPDILDRMGYLIAIFYTLEQIRGGARSVQWLRAPNTGSPFFGRPPLEYMLEGRMADLIETYRYLKGVATGAG